MGFLESVSLSFVPTLAAVGLAWRQAPRCDEEAEEETENSARR